MFSDLQNELVKIAKELSGPKRYYTGLSKAEKEKRSKQFETGKASDSGDPKSYPEDHVGDEGVETKESQYTKKYREMYGAKKKKAPAYRKALQNKAEESGIAYGILKKVYNRGLAAWRTGHRPGATQHQWAMARVNSYITKGKTYYTTDKDLRSKK